MSTEPHTTDPPSADLLANFLSAQPQQSHDFAAHYATLERLHRYLCDPSTAERIERDGAQTEYSHNLERLMDYVASALFIEQNTSDSISEPFQFHVIRHTLFAMLDSLCDDSTLRVKFAHKWLPSALCYMQSCFAVDDRDTPAQAKTSGPEVPYFLSRACCAVLVNVVRSPEARTCFTDLSALAGCIRYSSDMYLQLQCCEVIFCVSRTNTTSLGTVRDLLGEHTIAAIEKLTSTPRVLFDMCGIIQRVPSKWGSEAFTANNSAICVINVSEIAIPPLLRNEGTNPDPSLWYRHTALDGGLMQAFFGKTMLVLDWAYEPELTIPYTAMRTIKLNRNKQLVIRLSEVPFSMRTIYKEMLERAQQSNIPKSEIVPLVGAGGMPLPFASVAEGHADDSTPFPEIIVSITHAEYRKMRDSNVHKWISNEIGAGKKAAMAKRDEPTPVVQNAEMQEADETNISAQTPPFEVSERTVSSQSEYVALEPREKSQRRDGFSAFAGLTPTFGSQTSLSLFPSPFDAPSAPRAPLPPLTSHSYTDEIDPLLQELKQMVTQKVSVRHQEGQHILDEAQRRIHAEIQALRSRSEERFAKHNENVQKQLEAMRRSQNDIQMKMASLVDKLNLDVRSMAEQSKILQDQFTVMGLEGTQSIEELRRHQEDQVSVMNESVSTNLRALKERIHAAVSSTNPLRFMTQFLAQSEEFTDSSQGSVPKRSSSMQGGNEKEC